MVKVTRILSEDSCSNRLTSKEFSTKRAMVLLWHILPRIGQVSLNIGQLSVDDNGGLSSSPLMPQNGGRERKRTPVSWSSKVSASRQANAVPAVVGSAMLMQAKP